MSINSLTRIAITIVAGTIFAGASSAAVIGVDFNNGGASGQAPGSADIVGPYASSGWVNLFNLQSAPIYLTNNIFNPSDHGSPATLVDSTGATTTTQFGFNSYGMPTLNGGSTYGPDYGAFGSANAGLTPNQQLYNGVAAVSPNGYTQQVSLINVPYAVYDVYILVGAMTGDPGYGPSVPGLGQVTMYTDYNPSTNTATTGPSYWFSSITTGQVPPSDFSFIQAIGTSQGTATLGANYVRFSGLTSPNVVFDLFSPSADNNNGAFMGGIQIVSVPEPTTAMLGGVGAVLLAFRRRKKAALS